MKDYSLNFLRNILINFRINFIILFVFLVIALISFYFLRAVILENTQKLGQEISRSYSVEEEKNIQAYKDFLTRIAILVEKTENANSSNEWLSDTLKAFSVSDEENYIDPYVIRDGNIVAANPWEGDDEYDYANTEWYQKAVAAKGKIIFTDTYIDVVTKDPVITLAKETSIKGEIVAIDIFPNNFRHITNHSKLPDESYYYLCDTVGNLLYTTDSLDTESPEVIDYIKNIFEEIKAGKHQDPDSTVIGLDGQKRVVYYNVSQNGWISFITIPYHTIVHEAYLTFYIALAFLFVFIVITVYGIAREYRLKIKIKRFIETINFLGNMYYTIYRINYRDNSFEIIKCYPDLSDKIRHIQNYDEMLKIIVEVIEPSAQQEFLDFFSIQNIRKLVAENVKDSGGDYLRKFGDKYEWVNARLVIDNNLNKDEVILCFRQVDEEKKQQLRQMELLRSSLQSARRSENARNAFFSNMSHDMRTPLNAIIGLTSIAKEPGTDIEQVYEYLDKIKISSTQLLDLINHILDMSRLEQGKINIEYAETNLRKCFGDCLSLFEEQAKREGKHFSVEYDLHDEMVITSCFRINQIMNNIVSNAFKYSEKGDSITVKICQLDRKKTSQFQITVADTGIGMTQEFLDKIFIPYERETRFGVQGVIGTGLGMSIVKNIITNLDGEISIQSELHKGTTVIIVLPIEVIESSSQELGQSDIMWDNLKDLNVLLVEDNSINMQITAKLLEIKGVNVYKAWNGEDAIREFESISEGFFDIILMDMQMPKMNGIEATKIIRSLGRKDSATVPIVALTANAFAEDVVATAQAGMNAHISKPINVDVLYKTILNLVKKKKHN